MDSGCYNGRQRCRVGRLAEQLKLLFHRIDTCCKWRWRLYIKEETKRESLIIHHTQLQTDTGVGCREWHEDGLSAWYLQFELTQNVAKISLSVRQTSFFLWLLPIVHSFLTVAKDWRCQNWAVDMIMSYPSNSLWMFLWKVIIQTFNVCLSFFDIFSYT